MGPNEEQRGPTEPILQGRRRRLPLGSWLVLMAIVVVTNLVFGFSDAKNQLTVPYSDFVNQAKSDNVRSANLQGTQVNGEFVHAFKGNNLYFTQVPVIGAAGDTNLIPLLLDHHVQLTANPSTIDWLGNAFNALSGLLFFIFLGALIYQARTGQRLALGVGQSKARLYSEERPKTTFADVASNEEAKADLGEIIDYLRDPTKYRRIGARIPRGVLLYGPPGTGKTLIARAVAGEARVPFFSVSATEFVEMFVGVGAARIRDLFDRAKKVAPCIIFVDEIDAIGRQRSGALSIGGNDEREQTLNQLLVEMDGFEDNQSVIVLAATNRPEILDAALLRPGRFDRRVEVGLPDRNGRLAILRLHASKVAMDESCDLEALARRTPGFAGADLANLINEAALAAARAGRDKVTPADLEEAFDRIILGARRRLALSDEDKQRVAIHEGGHTLVAFLTPGADRLEKVTIVPHGRALGVTLFDLDDRVNLAESYVRARLAVALGGRAAERLILGEISSGAENDMEAATSYAHRMVEKWGMGEELGPVTVSRDGYVGAPDPLAGGPELATLADRDVRRILREADEQALRVLTDHRVELEKLAALLVERETVERSEVEALVSAGSQAGAPAAT